jgi:hypothetical protein
MDDRDMPVGGSPEGKGALPPSMAYWLYLKGQARGVRQPTPGFVMPSTPDRPGQVPPVSPARDQAHDSPAVREAVNFVVGTTKAFLKRGFTRAIDAIAPGMGTALDLLDTFLMVLKSAKAVIQGSGDVAIPIPYVIDGIEVIADLRIGGDSASNALPLSVHLAPAEALLFEQIEVTVLDRTGQKTTGEPGHLASAVAVKADLSSVARVEDRRDQSALIRNAAQRQLGTRLREQQVDVAALDLIFVYDSAAGIAAWMRLAGEMIQWCILARVTASR